MRTGMKKRVLLVDDDFAVLAGLAGALVSEGYNVVHAADGDEAIEKFRNDRCFDLVLLDLNMPKKSGWDVFERITAIDPFMPVIVITARPDQYATAVAAGVGALIEKPLDLPFMLQKMEDLMRESAQERLARMSGRNPNISYCPAPKKLNEEVLGQVIDPAKAMRRLQDHTSTNKTTGSRKGPLDLLLKDWTNCSEHERQFFLEEMRRIAGRSSNPVTRDPVPPNSFEVNSATGKTREHRIVEADFFPPNGEGVEEDSSASRNLALEKSKEFVPHANKAPSAF
jgi:DNA-binding response OmpR family regulator